MGTIATTMMNTSKSECNQCEEYGDNCSDDTIGKANKKEETWVLSVKYRNAWSQWKGKGQIEEDG